MHGTGFIPVGAVDLAVVAHNATLTGSERVDSPDTQPAEPVAAESARSEVTSFALGISATLIDPRHGTTARQSDLAMSSRAFLARAAPIAVFTLFCSSGGGSTAGRPSASIHNSRVQPVV